MTDSPRPDARALIAEAIAYLAPEREALYVSQEFHNSGPWIVHGPGGNRSPKLCRFGTIAEAERARDAIQRWNDAICRELEAELQQNDFFLQYVEAPNCQMATENATLRADAKRLDWLNARDVSVWDGGTEPVVAVHRGGTTSGVRAAIDAAMQQETKP